MIAPRYKSHFHVRTVSPDLVFFLGESGCKILSGTILHLIAPWIDGTRTSSDIAAKLAGRATPFDVDCGLQMLEAEGLITFNPQASGIDLLRDSWNVDPSQFAKRLRKVPVGVRSFGALSPDSIASMLQQLGVRVSPEADFQILLTDDYLREELQDWNRKALRSKRPWMPVKPSGSVLWIGPVFPGRDSPCWECLATRWKQNREAESFILKHAGSHPAPRSFPSLPSVADIALHLATLELLRWIAFDRKSPQAGTLMTFDARTMKLERHTVVRLDDCAACGSAGGRAGRPKPRQLKSGKKLFAQEGGYRVTTAEQTFRKYEHHISPITGIVDQIEPYYSDGGLIHSWIAGHLFVPHTNREELLERGVKQTSAGKGMTAQQARTGALCEALERYSGVYRGSEFKVRASYRDLGDRAIHPNAYMNFSRKQFGEHGVSGDWIPRQFNESRKIEWTPLWSLTHGDWKYLPTACCYYGYPELREFFKADSNGNAAGNTREEAILQGFLELVERDSASLWWYNRARRPGVDVQSFAQPYLQALIDSYESLGLRIWILDITADFPVPAFASLAARKDSTNSEFLLGLGAHLDPVIALSRAMTEMNQFLPVFLSGGSKRIVRATSQNIEFLMPEPSFPLRQHRDFRPYPSTLDLRKDILNCVQMARERGMETLILDQTRSDVGLPVVKVVAPGMRQLWPRFAPGRLYDVPVQLGWLPKPLKESELNPDRIVL